VEIDPPRADVGGCAHLVAADLPRARTLLSLGRCVFCETAGMHSLQARFSFGPLPTGPRRPPRTWIVPRSGTRLLWLALQL